MTQRLLDKPTAEQVFMFTHVIGQNPRTDRNEAYSVLQQWMEGKLEVEVESTHFSRDNNAHVMGPNDPACLACLAGCNIVFGGTNPVCVAICLAGPCK